ncbi:MAG: hypothetical protein J6X89_01755 [Bacteroidales bacterium]|nr:hypothetical protein [Bacteroidales bacterium]
MKRLACVFVGAMALFLNAACDGRLNPDIYFEETAEGRNVLSFTFNGEGVYQKTSGGFPSEAPLSRWATYKEDAESGSIVVEARLNHRDFYWLSFSIPQAEAAEGAQFKPEMDFEYVYLPELSHLGEPESGPGYTSTPVVIDREQECRNATVTEATVKIRKWSRGEKVLAGNFTMKGHYTDSTGKVIQFHVKDGMFDVTDDTVYFTR